MAEDVIYPHSQITVSNCPTYWIDALVYIGLMIQCHNGQSKWTILRSNYHCLGHTRYHFQCQPNLGYVNYIMTYRTNATSKSGRSKTDNNMNYQTDQDLKFRERAIMKPYYQLFQLYIWNILPNFVFSHLLVCEKAFN